MICWCGHPQAQHWSDGVCSTSHCACLAYDFNNEESQRLARTKKGTTEESVRAERKRLLELVRAQLAKSSASNSYDALLNDAHLLEFLVHELEK